MKIKNLDINWKNVKKTIAAGAALIIVTGGVLLGSKLVNDAKTNNNGQQNYAIINDEIEDYSYSAPDGYTLEVINGKVFDVKRDKETKDLIKVMTSDGKITYRAPNGFYIEGDKAVRIIKTIMEPDIVYNTHSK